jgi:methylglutaconyl-CoA hydratase
MSQTKILTSLDGGVLTLTLDGPERRNALNDEAMAALDTAMDRAERDDAVRAVVLAAVGVSFCAGMDVGQLRTVTSATPAASIEHATKMAESMCRLATLGKPTIAAVQGSAYGGGVGLVAACDIVIAADTARFALTEVRLGLLPGLVAPMMAAAIGARAARRLLLTGQSIDAQEALRLGLVHEVVPPEKLAATVAETAEQLRAGSTATIAATKRLLADPALKFPDPRSVRPIAELVMAHRGSPDAQEGIAAFLEKRKPSWAV